MTALSFSISGAQPASHTAAPAIVFRLRVAEASGRRMHAMALRCHCRIEARRRRYTPDEQERLYEVFGHPSQWERTLQSVTWSQTAMMVPTFEGATEVDLTLPCTYDLEVAASKYLHALRDGEVPLVFLFSGTVFIVNHGSMEVEPVSWDLDATYRMPAAVWRATMDKFFPGGGWLRLHRDTLDRLQAFRGRHALVGWDEAIDLLLQSAASEHV